MALFLTACENEAERTYTIDEVTIEAHIDDRGSLHVQELFTYTFDGSFNGVTRSSTSKLHDFKGYEIRDINQPIEEEKSEALPVEYNNEEEEYQIYTKSENETKTVLFTYHVEDTVKKYSDIGEFTYAFFDKASQNDINNVHITIYSPEKEAHTHEAYAFLKNSKAGNLTFDNKAVTYENEKLKHNDYPKIQFLFPASELKAMKVSKDKLMLETLLEKEAEWVAREENLQAKQNSVQPVIIGFSILVLLLGLILYRTHPKHYRGSKNETDMIQLLEAADPLYVSFLKTETLGDEGLIAALFSLKRRDILTFDEIDSVLNEGEKTYRITWVNDRTKVDTADQFLKEWLFTDSTTSSKSFLLENIIDNPDEAESIRKTKAKEFDKAKETWESLVYERDAFSTIYKRYRGYELFAIFFMVVTAGFFYHFITFDMLTPAIQLALKISLGVLTIAGIFFARYKFSSLLFYLILTILAMISFTMTGAGILLIGFYALTLMMLMLIPSRYPNKTARQYKYSIKVADNMIWKKRYPIETTKEKIENQFMLAIIIGMGSEFAEQYGKKEFVEQFSKENSLLSNPTLVANTFSNDNIVLYSMLIIASTTSTGASTFTGGNSGGGGGGAGAF